MFYSTNKMEGDMRRGFYSPPLEGDHLLSSYHFDLPKELIAQRPFEPRCHSRLLCSEISDDGFLLRHQYFYNLINLLPPKSVLVLNQSKVFPCRLPVEKATGGKGEIFFLEQKCGASGKFSALIKSNSKKEIGQCFFAKNFPKLSISIAQICGAEESVFFLVEVEFEGQKIVDLKSIDELLYVPIPPYIRNGESDLRDKCDYQTIYAKKNKGQYNSAAAPTAGLHFSASLLEQLQKKGIEFLFIDLHVGLGTFSPIKKENLLDHRMHREHFSISQEVLRKLTEFYRQEKNIIAVGTTTLRALESWYQKRNEISLDQDFHSSTDIFLHPGIAVQSIDGLITNFHLPQSSLLVLVSALIGRKQTMSIYQQAIEQKYRFFSYGDALFISHFQRGNR